MWRSPSEFPRLSVDEVHIWRSPLNVPRSTQDVLIQFLSADEHKRAERFRFDQHRQQFITTRGLLRYLLGRYLETDPAHVQFVYGPYGKPALDSSNSGQFLSFNLSHSHHQALYAIAGNRPIGIDIEYERPIQTIDQLAQRFFTAKEYLSLASLPPEQKQAAFFCGWTRKEAYLKATGQGLIGLSRVEVTVLPDQAPQVLNLADTLSSPSDWILQDISSGEGYWSAIAIPAPSLRLSYWQWSPVQDLM
jgi:4'-phosphopantetheinyl transferase